MLSFFILTIQNASYPIPKGYHDDNGKVTINIKKGVNVGGVVGTYGGSGNNRR